MGSGHWRLLSEDRYRAMTAPSELQRTVFRLIFEEL
jgi:hypothetical protein